MFLILRFVRIFISDMTETAEYLPYLHLDDVFITGIVSMTIGANHVLWNYYRHVSNMVLAKLLSVVTKTRFRNIFTI